MQNILLNWQLGNVSGWGILGLNLFSQWAKLDGVRPLMGRAISEQDIAYIDPLRVNYLASAFRTSNDFLRAMKPDSSGKMKMKGIVIDGVGNDLSGGDIVGQSNIGRCVFEDTSLRDAKNKLARYDALVVASSWNAALLEERTGRKPKVIFEGVDTSIFCPGPRSGIFEADRFHIFSGGKVEFRKGQDLTMRAFKIFSDRHPDAVLVTAWQSLWPRASVGFKGTLDQPLAQRSDGMLDVQGWAHANGINPNKVLDLGQVPNPLMPVILREMDVALQPSRAEACTNLPAKEAMAVGLPVIVGLNTGMLDLVAEGNCIPLKRQLPVTGQEPNGTEGWGESDIDEIVEALERAYNDRNGAARLGSEASRWISSNGRTWDVHAQDLWSWLTSFR